jgi:hypothetical protein
VVNRLPRLVKWDIRVRENWTRQVWFVVSSLN